MRKSNQIIILNLSALITEHVLEIKVNMIFSQGQLKYTSFCRNLKYEPLENPHLPWEKLSRLRSTIKMWCGISDCLNEIYVV